MADFLRVHFLTFYGAMAAIFLLRVVPSGFWSPPAERQAEGLWRWLPALLIPLNFLAPPLLISLRVGELPGRWTPVCWLGFLLSLYAAVMLSWASATLGRFLVPRAMVVPDHALVTSGPYRFVRHPIYSGSLALWLGAALGTLNLALLALWPVGIFGTGLQIRQEEKLLALKFGAAFEGYAGRTRRLVPRPGTGRS